jgi:hypothetical protein
MHHHDPTLGDDALAGLAGQELSVDDIANATADPATAATTPGIEQQVHPPLPQPVPGPAIPVLPKRPVSGRYRGRTGAFELELRVDVDRVRPLKKLSGDFFQIAGATKIYFGSLIVQSPAVTVTPNLVTIEGSGQYTYPTGAPKVKVTIPRVTTLQPPAPATLQFFTTNNAPGATYLCNFESPFFRTLQIETDRVSDVTSPVFATYDTGSLPSPPPTRPLSVAGAYNEAGIQVQISAASNVINVSGAVNGFWSNAELHASMLQHFSLWTEQPQFRVWEVVAQKHDLHNQNPPLRLLGIMFDQFGKQRQGCAVFHEFLAGTTPDVLRRQLYTYVHELGHCFNLLHSWQKSLAQPPGVNRPAALSWMNYPQNYPLGGEPAFWNAFPFQFDDPELAHIRHAFRNHVIMGGSNFAVNSGLVDAERFSRPIEDNSGLQLEIAAKRTFLYGEPVAVEIKLKTTDSRGKDVTPYLHPNMGLVDIAIQKPGGAIFAYRPMIEHCVEPQIARLETTGPISETAYIGYGKDGLYFDAPGLYKIKAVYTAPDGSQVVSNAIDLRVRSPLTPTEEEIAEQYLGEEQGILFYLAGSDSESLRSGNAALDQVLEKHGEHPLANYARLAKGINAGREFKTILPNTSDVYVRSPNEEESQQLLAGLAGASAAGRAAGRATFGAAALGGRDYEETMAAVGGAIARPEAAPRGRNR